MAYSLAKENEKFIKRMIRLGRFNDQSEVLRRMEREENSYLNPARFSTQELREIYAPNIAEERLERTTAKVVQRSLRKAAAKVKSHEEL
jgi:Arc/MetJ-type ribon-helix-helix transcriptional regulator